MCKRRSQFAALGRMLDCSQNNENAQHFSHLKGIERGLAQMKRISTDFISENL